MDPVCHTLVGASLGATGLANKTRHGMLTLMVAANLPDIDFVFYFRDDASAYAFRRGITHGIPAILLLPVLLALAIAVLSRRFSSANTGPAVSLRWLIILSLIGVASHPALDWLNNYGMRWLMPMVDRWFYGDTLYIVDGIVWTALIAGLVAARRMNLDKLRWYRQPTTISLAFIVTYISISFAMTQSAEQLALQNTLEDPPDRLLASPVPFKPLERAMIFDYEGEYRFGTVRFGPRPRFEWGEAVIPKGDPEVLERARRTRDGGWFLRWSRFPYSVVDVSGEGTQVQLADARYVREIDEPRLRSFGAISVELTVP
ncbi:MAG: metal-dependent hydrolase [Candidatus Rariloculaceae bacterium]